MADPGLDLDIDASEISELIKQFPQYTDIVLNETEMAMLSSLLKFQELIIGNTPTGVTGDLSKKFLVSKPVLRGQSLVGSVSTDLPYGFPVELGRLPGSFPPVDAIEFWIKRTWNNVPPANKIRGVAFVVARSIARKGIKGVFMVANAFEDGSPKALELFDTALQKATARIEKKIEAIN